MNRKQREQNRLNFKMLRSNAHICSNCGERGFHYLSIPESVQDILLGVPSTGFWVCREYYDEDGKRKETQ